jgi:hypothetical protein
MIIDDHSGPLGVRCLLHRSARFSHQFNQSPPTKTTLFLIPDISDFKQSSFIKAVVDVRERCRPERHFPSILLKLKANEKYPIGTSMRNKKRSLCG